MTAFTDHGSSAVPGRLHLDPRGITWIEERRIRKPSESWAILVKALLINGCFFQWRGKGSFSRHLFQPVDYVTHTRWENPNARTREVWWTSHGKLIDAYRHQVQLLLRSVAPQVLAMGGIAWRLAVEYGSPTDLQRAAERPSYKFLSHCTTHPSEIPVSTVTDNHLYADEIRVLFGQLLDGKSLWPHPDIFNKTMAWNGYWEKHNEEWFQKRLHHLQTVPNPTLYDDTQWHNIIIKDLPPELRRSKVDEGSLAFAEGELREEPELIKYAVIDLQAGPVGRWP